MDLIMDTTKRSVKVPGKAYSRLIKSYLNFEMTGWSPDQNISILGKNIFELMWNIEKSIKVQLVEKDKL